MGLDVVEMVLEIEDEFDIAIPDEDYQHLSTVGNLTEYVTRQLAAAGRLDASPGEVTPCSTSRHFVHLRQTMIDLYGLPRASLRVRKPVEDLVPMEARPDQWQRLGTALSLPLPPLSRPEWLNQLLVMSPVMLFLILMVSWGVLERLGAAAEATLGIAVLACLVAGIALIVAAYRLTRPLAIHVPAWLTVGSLVLLIEKQQRQLHRGEPRWNRSEAVLAIRRIVAEHLNVPLDQVTREARFVEDLGAD